MSSYSRIIMQCPRTARLSIQQQITRKRIRNVRPSLSCYSSSRSLTKSYNLHPNNHNLRRILPKNHRYHYDPCSSSSILSCFSTLTDTIATHNDDPNNENEHPTYPTETNNSNQSDRKKELMEYMQELVNYNTEHFLYHLNSMHRNTRDGKRRNNTLKKFKHELRRNYYREKMKERQQQREKQQRQKENWDYPNENEEANEISSVWNDESDSSDMKSSSSSLLDLHHNDDGTGSIIANSEDDKDGNEMKSSSASLLDLLDDHNGEDDHKSMPEDIDKEYEFDMSEEDSKENKWKSEEDTKISESDFGSPSSQSSSLLDLLDDYDKGDFSSKIDTKSKINTGEALSESSGENEWKREETTIRDETASAKSSPSLLDLLDDYSDDFTTAKTAPSDQTIVRENTMDRDPHPPSSSPATEPQSSSSLLSLMNENYDQVLEHKNEDETAGESTSSEKSGGGLLDLLDENYTGDNYENTRKNELQGDNTSNFTLQQDNSDDDSGETKKVPSLLELLEDDDAFNLLMGDKETQSISPTAATTVSSIPTIDSTENYGEKENSDDGYLDFPSSSNAENTTITPVMSDVNIFTNYDNYNDHFQDSKCEEQDNNGEKEEAKEDEEKDDNLDTTFDSIFDRYDYTKEETEKKRVQAEFNEDGHDYDNHYQCNGYYEPSLAQPPRQRKPRTFKEILNRAIALRTVTRRRDWDILFHQNSDAEEKIKDDEAVVDDKSENSDQYEDDGNTVDASPLFPSFSEEEKEELKGDNDTFNFPRSSDENHDAILSVVQELLNGCTNNQWALSVDEFNLLLLHVAASADATAAATHSPSTSPSSSSYEERIQLLFRIYNLMTEVSALQYAGVVANNQKQLTVHGEGKEEKGVDGDFKHNIGATSCAPDATTYFIILTALEQSGDMDTASKLCTKLLLKRDKAASQASSRTDAAVTTEMDILNDNGLFHAHNIGYDAGFELDDRLLDVAMRILRQRHRLNAAQQLFDWATFEHVDSEEKAQVKCSVFKSLLRLYKEENMQKEAAKLIDICVRENGHHDRRGVNGFLLSLIQWPKKSRDGRYIRISSHCQAILDAFERMNEVDYCPNYKIWKQLLLSAVNAAKFESPTHWKLVNRTFRAMMDSLPLNSYPDHVVLRVGLDAAESTKDPKLAYDIISWAWKVDEQGRADVGFQSNFGDFVLDDSNINHSVLHDDPDPNTWSENKSLPEKQRRNLHVPPQAYLRVVRLCVDGDEVDLARDILRHCTKTNDRIPETLLRQMYTFVMAGYAKAGDVDRTKQLLSEMQNDGPQPSEKSYGAVIHALSINKKAEEASEIIESMLSNDYGDGVQPGPSSYASCMLSLVQSKDWEGVLSLNEKMHNSGVQYNPTTFQGVVMAHHHLGNSLRALEVIEQTCQTELAMDLGVFQTCVKLFLPDEFKNVDISHVRKELRHIGEKEPKLATVALNLGRSLRIAELNKNRRLDVIRQGWNNVIENLVKYIRKRDSNL